MEGERKTPAGILVASDALGRVRLTTDRNIHVHTVGQSGDD